MYGLFVPIVIVGLMVHVSVFIVVTVCGCHIELKSYLLACSPVFSARQHAERAICYRLSVCPSVTRVDQSKTVEVRIMRFSPYSSPIPLVFAG